LGGSSLKRSEDGRGGVLGVETVEVDDECDRLTFFAAGWCSLDVVAELGGERWDDARELLGSWMPSNGSDSDLRRVL
jgi:hypothetical protein